MSFLLLLYVPVKKVQVGTFFLSSWIAEHKVSQLSASGESGTIPSRRITCLGQHCVEHGMKWNGLEWNGLELHVYHEPVLQGSI